MAGILASITTNVPNWNWHGFPSVYTATYTLIEIVGFILAGMLQSHENLLRQSELRQSALVSRAAKGKPLGN